MFFLLKGGKNMLTLIIGIILSIIITIIMVKLKDDSLLFFMVVPLIFVSIVVSNIFAFSGYNDWKLVKETELISLSNSTASGSPNIYVSLLADNSYTYRFEIDSSFGTNTSKEYKTATIVNNNNVTEIEDPNCQKPVLLEYESTAKKSIWTFGANSQTAYVFYVPEGTISKDVTLQ